ncbi:MAG: c-type cytochrome [Prolixibacteraceae bacterium]|nr:c-type cytochrome [Burkholderiales bacterium]
MKLKALTISMVLVVSTSACAEDKQASDAKPADKQAAQTAPAPQAATTPATTTPAPSPAAEQPTADASAPQKVAGAAAEKPAAAENPTAADKPAAVDKPAAGGEASGGGGGGGAAPYKVSEDGKKVDEKTHKGYGIYTNVCVPCHGRDATGGMGGGANLVESLKKLSAEDAKNIILNGKPGTLMAGFKSQQPVADNIDGIYAYLKGRSDGKIWGKSLEKMQ